MRGTGRVVFAATLLLIAGTLNIIYGIGALDDANIFTNDKRYILTNLNTLGWVLIVLGLIQPHWRPLAGRRQDIRPDHRNRRRQPRCDRGPAVDRRFLPVVVAGHLLLVRVHRPRYLRLRRGRDGAGNLIAGTGTASGLRPSPLPPSRRPHSNPQPGRDCWFHARQSSGVVEADYRPPRRTPPQT